MAARAASITGIPARVAQGLAANGSGVAGPRLGPVPRCMATQQGGPDGVAVQQGQGAVSAAPEYGECSSLLGAGQGAATVS